MTALQTMFNSTSVSADNTISYKTSDMDIEAMVCSCAAMFKFFSVPPDGTSIEDEILNRGFSDFLPMHYCDFSYHACTNASEF